MNTHGRRLLLAGVTGLAAFLAGWASDALLREADGCAPLWPCSAVILGMLIACTRDRRDLVAIAGAGGVASIFLHTVFGEPRATIALCAAANVVAPVLARTLLRRLGRRAGMFDRVSDVAALVVACAAACTLSATLATFAAWLAHPLRIVPYWLDWYGSNLLSQLIVSPTIVVGVQLSDRRRARAIAGRTVLELIVVLGIVAAATAAVFLGSDQPLLFTITPVVLLATFRLRTFGAVAAVAIVAVVAGYATAAGHGPVVAAADDPAGQVLLLQLFLACCFLVALPVAAVLSERDQRAEEARILADRFQTVVESIGEVIFRVDRDGRWAYLNPAWEVLSGLSIGAVLGRPWLELFDEPERTELAARLTPVLRGEGRSARRAARLNTAIGPRWVELFVQPLRDAEGRPVGATGTLRDIDDRKRLEEHVMTAKRRAEQRAREATLLASTDELTGIANRRAFMAQLDREIAGADEFGWPLAVAMFDVDHFKRVNDRHGHATGDRVLQQIAARAGAAVRAGDLVGRLGGEEFGILMPGATAADATIIAERLRAAVEGEAESETTPAVTISIGLAECQGQRHAKALLAAADEALYAAKRAGRNRVKIAA